VDRNRLSLGEPPTDCTPLRSGPGHVPSKTIFRCSRNVHSEPWFFSSDGGGRFDLRSPVGTCYLGSDKVAALREVLGPDYTTGAIVAHKFFDERRIWNAVPISAAWSRGVADLLEDQWDAHGITTELFTTTRYPLTQAWAACFHAAGWQGLRVGLRHVLAADRSGVALFGPEGAQVTDARFVATGTAIESHDRDAFTAATGIRIEATLVAATALHVIT